MPKPKPKIRLEYAIELQEEVSIRISGSNCEGLILEFVIADLGTGTYVRHVCVQLAEELRQLAKDLEATT